MKDVALAAGVSPATVATDLGWFGPNTAGRALRTGVVGALGVMFGESSSFVFDDKVILPTCLVVRQSAGAP